MLFTGVVAAAAIAISFSSYLSRLLDVSQTLVTLGVIVAMGTVNALGAAQASGAVDLRNVPGDFALQFGEVTKNEVDHRPERAGLGRIQRGRILLNHLSRAGL